MSSEKKAPEEKIEKEDVEAEKKPALFFKQLLCGREYGDQSKVQDPMQAMVLGFGVSMKNFSYVVGDKSTKEAFIVDPAWDPIGILNYVEKTLKYTVKGVILTHGHMDHCGGEPPPPYNSFGIMVPGVSDLVRARANLTIYCHEKEIELIEQVCHMKGKKAFTGVKDGGTFKVGGLTIKCHHTPGHTKGSACFSIEGTGQIITGDTLFVGSCGRMDFYKEGPKQMYHSLQKLAKLPEDWVVWPGHAYAGEKSTIKQEKTKGLLKKMTLAEWEKSHQPNCE